MSPVSAPAHALTHAPERVPSPRLKPTPRPDHLRVVRPAERRRARLRPVTAVILTALLFLLLFAVAVAHTMLVQGQVRLDQLDSELAKEQGRYQELRIDVATLESPERIVSAAQAQGMVAPDDLVYLQPSIPDASTSGDDPVETTIAANAGTGDDGDDDWSTVKPLLAAPAP